MEVCDPIVKDGVQKYILYTVRGTDKKGKFEVLRRYSDFVALRDILVKRWPGCYIPPLPPKKAVVHLPFRSKRVTWMQNSSKKEENFLSSFAKDWHC